MCVYRERRKKKKNYSLINKLSFAQVYIIIMLNIFAEKWTFQLKRLIQEQDWEICTYVCLIYMMRDSLSM